MMMSRLRLEGLPEYQLLMEGLNRLERDLIEDLIRVNTNISDTAYVRGQISMIRCVRELPKQLFKEDEYATKEKALPQ